MHSNNVNMTVKKNINHPTLHFFQLRITNSCLPIRTVCIHIHNDDGHLRTINISTKNASQYIRAKSCMRMISLGDNKNSMNRNFKLQTTYLRLCQAE